MSSKSQRGEGRIGLLVMLALVGAAIFVAVRVIPVRVAAYEFRDFVALECRSAAVRPEDATIVKRILDKAKELELPLQKKDLKVQRSGREMLISATFVKPINLQVGTYDFRFQVVERAPLF